jgi:antitoxin YefM
MKVLPVSEVKMKLSALLEDLGLGQEEVMITRNGHAAGVILAPEVFESWRETLAVLEDADLMTEIQEGLAALKASASLCTLDELFEE